MHIKDNNNSPHGKFHRFLFPFANKFPDLNFDPYVLYIYSYYMKPVRDTNSEPGLPVVLNINFDSCKAMRNTTLCTGPQLGSAFQDSSHCSSLIACAIFCVCQRDMLFRLQWVKKARGKR